MTAGTNSTRFRDLSLDLGPLPVDLLTFTANPRSGHVVLDWTFDNARGFDRFEVEHRTDRSEWSEIATVIYDDNISRAKQANTIHRQPVAGVVNYYRLRMVDIDGSREYSRIQSVRIDGSGLIAPVNTMVDSELIVRREGDFAADAELMIIDLQGRVMLHQPLMKDQIDVSIPMSSFSTGMYLLQVITPDATNTFPVLCVGTPNKHHSIFKLKRSTISRCSSVFISNL